MRRRDFGRLSRADVHWNSMRPGGKSRRLVLCAGSGLDFVAGVGGFAGSVVDSDGDFAECQIVAEGGQEVSAVRLGESRGVVGEDDDGWGLGADLGGVEDSRPAV